MRGKHIFLLASLFAMILCITLLATDPDSLAAQSSEVIQSQDSDFDGVVVDLVQCKRKKGVLTVKFKVRNTNNKTTRMYWSDVNKNVYLMDTENQKKYFVLKDAKGEYIYGGGSHDIPAQGTKTSWFKFPAPPAEIKEITIILPGCAPFEDVPITDK